MPKSTSQFEKSKPIKIGIAGENMTDGMGDFGHIINVGQALSREGVADVTYHIVWGIVDYNNKELSQNTKDASRLNQLADKLKYLNIIPLDQDVTGKTIDEFIDNINEAAKGKFEIIGRNKDIKISGTSQDLWINVSHGDFKGIRQENNLDYIKYITLDELSNNSVATHGNNGKYTMGFPNRNGGACGLLLNDQINRSIENRINSASQIKNPKFNQLIASRQGNLDLKHIIETTEFIPAYLQHLDPKDASSLVVECLTKVSKEKNVFIKLAGTYDFDYLINHDGKIKLKMCGFTEIEYLDNGGVKSISLDKLAIPKRSLKLLTECYLHEKENIEFTKLTGSFYICSGDNSLQEAISYGAIPIFIPHQQYGNSKKEALSNLKYLLEEKNFPVSATFFENYDWRHGEFSVIKNCHKITPELIKEWPTACKEIIQNCDLNKLLNLYVNRLASTLQYRTAGDLLVKYFDTALQQRTLNIQDPKLDEYDLRPIIKSDEVYSTGEVIQAINSNSTINNFHPIIYAVDNNITLEGKSPVQYAIDNSIKINGQNAIIFSQFNAFMLGEDDYYIIDLKDNIKKSPLQYAIDHNKFIDGENPVIYAMKNSRPELIIDDPKDDIRKSPLQYAIDNEIKINDKDPKIWYEEWQKQQNQNILKDQAKEIGKTVKKAIPNEHLQEPITKANTTIIKNKTLINRE